ncbi:conserved hypothetical protein [Methanosarcina thermophila]|uniref:Uncharacterized protein n=1 Tax=Methanosarcina thermophila TaxID=2210 RepID=A0A3G9CWR2_METTE|nr:conserved hypothetical protein [Methanosarcina thermophila]
MPLQTYSNARSTKTRIETGFTLGCAAFFRDIRMQDPLKQGLKLADIFQSRMSARNSNARSTKTRIETDGLTRNERVISLIRMQDPLKQGLKLFLLIVSTHIISDSNARSTKTRIETRLRMWHIMRSVTFECKIH